MGGSNQGPPISMSRTYPVNVEGVGDFVFRKRMLKDQIAIQANASRMLGGPVEDAELRSFAHALATIELLTVQAPADWKPSEIDPLEPEQTQKLWDVHEGLRDAEEKFRKGA
jgi:hypothetical protein